MNRPIVVTYRSVERSDTDDLQALCWPETLYFDVETRVIDVLARNEKKLAWGLVAEVDGQCVGFGQLGVLGRRSEISDLIVHEALRGCGIGTGLITHLLDIARQNNLNDVEIGAAVSNPGALSLYQRLGFVEQRRVRLDLGSGLEPVIFLSKQQ